MHNLLALLRLGVVVGLVLRDVIRMLLLVLGRWKFGNVVFDAVRRNLESIFGGMLLISRRILLMMRFRVVGLDIPSFESWITANVSINGRNIDDPGV